MIHHETAADLIGISIKALLLYMTAVFAFRLGKQRILAEMSPFDFVAAVAVGAIVGRVPSASDAGYLAGATTLFTILSLHWVITKLRYYPSLAKFVDHRPRMLFANGQVFEHDLRACGLTPGDLFALLREHGIMDLNELQYVIYEERGQISIVRRLREGEESKLELLRDIVEQCDKKNAA
jgi:uncharacterized membrane protein YcaP (DUF421 family)